jgi:hypothetical protein
VEPHPITGSTGNRLWSHDKIECITKFSYQVATGKTKRPGRNQKTDVKRKIRKRHGRNPVLNPRKAAKNKTAGNNID